MVGKRKKSDGADVSPELHARIGKLARLLWDNNSSRMARDLGLDQAAIYRVLAGEQKPSAKLLEKLANWPDVNVGWFLQGRGEPLIETGARPGFGSFLPLLDELLPGRLAEHRERLSGVSYPVAAAFDSPTAYWYRVPPNSPVTKSRYGVRGGDLLLMETDENWTRKGGAVPGKFCGFRYKAGRKEIIELGWVDAFSKTVTYFGEVHYEQFEVDRFVPVTEKAAEEKAWLIVPTAADGDEDARRSVSGLCLSLSQVVCICLKLERPFTKGANQATPHTPHTPPE